MITLTNRQARQFMLVKHGLLGEYRFVGKDGAMDFIRQAGCIQYDPIDICGKNAELTLQSRVKKFRKNILDELLYQDRLLVDYPDKNTAIIPVEDWIYFGRQRRTVCQRTEEHPDMIGLMEQALAFIKEKGAACSNDLKLESDFQWRAFVVWSSGKNLFGSVMEQLYGTGELVIHHKKGTRKYYDLASRYIPAELLNAPEPLPDDFEYRKWRILRRIGAVGLLWNRPSDAFLCNTYMEMWPGGAKERKQLFSALSDEEKITAVTVEGLKEPLYFRSEDMKLIEAVLDTVKQKPRCEFIAPLDPFMWAGSKWLLNIKPTP